MNNTPLVYFYVQMGNENLSPVKHRSTQKSMKYTMKTEHVIKVEQRNRKHYQNRGKGLVYQKKKSLHPKENQAKDLKRKVIKKNIKNFTIGYLTLS